MITGTPRIFLWYIVFVQVNKNRNSFVSVANNLSKPDHSFSLIESQSKKLAVIECSGDNLVLPATIDNFITVPNLGWRKGIWLPPRAGTRAWVVGFNSHVSGSKHSFLGPVLRRLFNNRESKVMTFESVISAPSTSSALK